MVREGHSLEELTEVFKSSEEQFVGDPIWWVSYSSIDSARVRDRKSREYRNVKCIFFETVFLFIFAIAFVADVFLVVQTRPSARLSDIHSTFWNFTEAPSDFWSWASVDLVEKLYGSSDGTYAVVDVGASVVDTYLNNAFTVSSRPSVVGNTDMVLVGSVRFRQLRVSYSDCSDTFNYYNIASFCSSEYEGESNQDTASYGSSVPTYLEPAFQFTSSVDSNKIRSNSTGIRYPSNGYVFDLPPDRTAALAALTDLAASKWITVQTSAIIVEVNTYHPISDSFVVDRFLWEYPTGNTLVKTHESPLVVPSATVYLTWSIHSLSIILFSMDLLTVLLFFSALAWYVYQIYANSLPRMRKFVWFYLDTAFVVLFISLLVCRILLYTEMATVADPVELFAEPTAFFSIAKVSTIQSYVSSLQTGLVALLFLRSLKLLYLNKGRYILNLLTRNFNDAFAVVCLMALALIGFAIAFYIQIGSESVSQAFTFTGLSLITVQNFQTEWISESANGVSFINFISIWWIFFVYLILFPLFIIVAVWHTAEDAKGGSSSALSVWWATWRNKGDMLVEAVDSDEGIDIALLPPVVRRAILARRRRLKEKVEIAFELAADEYDEMDVWVSLDELEKVMKEDSFLSKLLGGGTGIETIDRIKGNSSTDSLEKKMHVAGNKGVKFGTEMDPNIKKVSNELTFMIAQAKDKIERDVAPLVASMNNLYQTVQTINLRVQQATQRKTLKTSLH